VVVMSDKKTVRKQFRDAVFRRDNYCCVLCGWGDDVEKLDAHHITDRNDIPNGGYVLENGITLCRDCHRSAEDGAFSPEELYRVIGSSKAKAFEAATRTEKP
jgi:5-methylcytosine-specific restriction endonuclease McrA